MIGYIVVEPDLRIERVPDRFLHWDDILWPPARNSLPEKVPGEPTQTFAANELYHRYQVADDDIAIYVWSRRDPNGLPGTILQDIRDRAKREVPTHGDA